MDTSSPTRAALGAALLAVALAGCAASGASRAGPPAPLALVAPDGSTVTLESLRAGQDLTVLAFWSAQCPCVRRYQARVDALLDAWPPERVRVIGVSSNVGEDHARVQAAARERGVRISIYRDEGAVVADALGARSTPTMVVLDRSGAVRYLGWLDNEHLPGDPDRQPWLDRALAALLEGRSDYQARAPVYGCVISRSLFGAPAGGCCSAKP